MQQKTKKKKRMSTFDSVNTLLVLLITLVTVYPLYFCVIASLSDPSQVVQGRTILWIKGFSLISYKNILRESRLWIGYRNTVIYTILGTTYNLLLTLPVSYALTKKFLPFRSVFSWYFFITMYFGGGMIPTYMLVKNLGLINTPWIMIIGSGVNCYNMIVARQYFSTAIPQDIYEAAYIDGASEMSCFTRIALPLAAPITAVLTLYYGVGHWNSYYQALLYVYRQEYQPLQMVLRTILMENQTAAIDYTSMDAEEIRYILDRAYQSQTMKYAFIFIACLPLLVLYPFLQKYFAKGIMIGAVKG